MCLVVMAYRVHQRYALIVAANRDEFFDRPTTAAHFWPDRPHILAGRDELAGGTWLGISRYGRFAALTNHRDLRHPRPAGTSRGILLVHALERDVTIHDARDMAGLNLVHGPIDALRYLNNIDGTDIPLKVGVHGLSNDLLNTPWPKVRRARDLLNKALGVDGDLEEDLFSLLADDTPAPLEELPDTGVGAEWEHLLSPIRIRSPRYGTRCSTVLLVGYDGEIRFVERELASGEQVLQELKLVMPTMGPK